MSLLEIRDLNVRFATTDGEVSAVNGINLDLERGATLGIVGESGSGKSQLSFALMGLLARNGRATGSVRFDGTEILMEFISDGDAAAPRLQQLRPPAAQLPLLFDQLLTAMRTMAGLGVVHGDLSPYNTLVADARTDEPRLVVIDVEERDGQVYWYPSRDTQPAFAD